jgi:vacuolar protein sorting-associated protein 35
LICFLGIDDLCYCKPHTSNYFRYLYFFEKGIPQITNTVIQDLIELIRTEKQSDNTASDPSEAFFASTLRYIEFQKQKGGSIGEKYEQIKTT